MFDPPGVSTETPEQFCGLENETGASIKSSGRSVFVDFLIIGATDPLFSLLNKRPNGADELWIPRESG